MSLLKNTIIYEQFEYKKCNECDKNFLSRSDIDKKFETCEPEFELNDFFYHYYVTLYANYGSKGYCIDCSIKLNIPINFDEKICKTSTNMCSLDIYHYIVKGQREKCKNPQCNNLFYYSRSIYSSGTLPIVCFKCFNENKFANLSRNYHEELMNYIKFSELKAKKPKKKYYFF